MSAPKSEDVGVRHVVSGLTARDRLDRYLRHAFPTWGRREISKLITGGGVAINGRFVTLGSWEVRNGDAITIAQPPADLPAGPAVLDPAWILTDDGAIIALNKPAGLLTEPTRWDTGANLRDLAIAHFACALWLPHRLDRDTSGLVVLARDADTGRWLDAQFKARTIKKHYVAVVRVPNRLEAQGEIVTRLDFMAQRRDRVQVVRAGGMWARTVYQAEPAQGQGVQQRQLVHLWPDTGRTHQLRVHLAYMDAPILGDRYYGDAASAPRLLLHAADLTLPPRDAQPARTWSAPIPPEFDVA